MAQPQPEHGNQDALRHAPVRQAVGGPIRIGGTSLGRHRHICAFFHSPNDHYQALLPFIKDGFDSGEKAVHIIDARRRADHIRRLATIGIDAAAAQEDGRLDLRTWADAHLRDGFFDHDRTRRLMNGIRQRSAQDGFPRVRFVTHMEWALEDRPGVEGLLQYEASANLVPLEDPVVCAYDLTRFRADVVVDVMRTHPLIIIGGILQENPFFVPPEEFLEELRARRGR
ncbi:MAG: MEDS domain-containing protein [Acidobacteriota bacterium]